MNKRTFGWCSGSLINVLKIDNGKATGLSLVWEEYDLFQGNTNKVSWNMFIILENTNDMEGKSIIRCNIKYVIAPPRI